MHDARFNPRQLSQARLRAGLSQEDLAYKVRELSGDSKAGQNSVSRHERGTHKPDGETVVLYAAATGREIGFFYTSGADEEDDEEAALLPSHLELLDALRPLATLFSHEREVAA